MPDGAGLSKPKPQATSPWYRSLLFKISTRLALIALIFVIVELAVVIAMYVRNPAELDQLLVSSEAARIAEQIPHDRTAGLRSADRVGSGATEDAIERAFAVYGLGGTIIMRENSGDLRLPSEPPASFMVSQTQREMWGDHFLVTGTRRVVVEDRPYWIVVAISAHGIEPFLPVIVNEVRVHVILPVGLLAIMFLILNFSVVGGVMRPLRSAIAAVDRIDPTDITARIKADASSWEVRTLVDSVNRMLERLEGSVLSLREFAGNAAHELRTPLSIMLLGIGKLPDGDAKAKLLKDAQGMKRLVGQMLDMAQASALTIEHGAEADLSIVAREVIADLTPLAIARGRTITFEDLGCPKINGHADAIGRALRNVAENALAHTPEGTGVDVTCGPGRVYEVRDHGPGIPAHLRAKVLDRFTRLNHRLSDGAGLGLAIALAIVQAHRGTIEIADAEGGGAVVRMTFSADQGNVCSVTP